MSYQVLARKWRPRRFSELVGQEHVVRALSHALDSGRVHHAFLFSGTRGVGKTTIARIFAKSLNCERGVSADPCGECSACRDIDAGRYVDLLEIDAASNTGVDDVRDLIENAQYVPSRGKYKVYLIDEVHMLSKNAFNALLKTLEEPPPHVVFLLATTDPQKLPVTVLSRCLQFNLRRLSEEEIEGQLRRVVDAEGVAHDAASLEELARAGNGSMRDALSLLDQAISHGGGALGGADVRAMLGTVARGDVLGLLRAVCADDGAALLAAVDRAAEFAPDFGLVLDELGRMLHRIALAQALGGARERGDEADAIAGYAAQLSPEETQLLYQLAVTGRRDLALAPSPRAGFEMALLRMLTFRRAAAGGGREEPAEAAAPAVKSPPPRPYAVASPPAAAAVREPPPAPAREAPPAAPASSAPAAPPGELTPSAWTALAMRLNLRGPARELAHNASLTSLRGNVLQLAIRPQHESFRNASTEAQLREALAPHLGALKLEFRVAPDAGAASAAEELKREREARLAAAESALTQDPVLNALISEFDARVVPGTVRAPDQT